MPTIPKTELPDFIKKAKVSNPSSAARILRKDDTADLALLSKSENPEIQALCRVLNVKLPK